MEINAPPLQLYIYIDVYENTKKSKKKRRIKHKERAFPYRQHAQLTHTTRNARCAHKKDNAPRVTLKIEHTAYDALKAHKACASKNTRNTETHTRQGNVKRARYTGHQKTCKWRHQTQNARNTRNGRSTHNAHHTQRAQDTRDTRNL
eukprot:GEMP01015816.1.p1 GENE.GEMP01015816.1~~GEMP01015816.1.p1  ORF type:complete len:147 (-),score=18.15 GEMP01015816.1:2219-2659(-)